MIELFPKRLAQYPKIQPFVILITGQLIPLKSSTGQPRLYNAHGGITNNHAI